MKTLLSCVRVVLLILTLWVVPPAQAASCNAWNGGNMAFGTINLLAGGVTDSTGKITYGCSANPGVRVLMCVSVGPDPGTSLYTPRRLTSGSNHMAFNIYTNASRTTIWGSKNSGGSYPPVPIVLDFLSGEYYKTNSVTLYGRVSASGQTGLPAGTYDTNSIGGWPIMVSFKEILPTDPVDCNGGGMANVNGTIYIQAVVKSDCRIDASTTMNFGTVFMSINQKIDSTSTITVTCNGGQSGNGYHIRLGDGLNASGQQRRMRGNLGYITYELYRDAQRSSRWGNSDYLGVAGTGTGQPQSYTVYGRVPIQTPPGAGLYTDTVVITLSY
ncbi:MAG TPA: spore coat U domain-containing protein [Castellaniella sp.]|nr:spore coat U domain-containing protein [Castellaniella sp.]